MDLSNHNSSKRSLIEEEANISTFRRRNKALIILLLFLIISLIIIISSLITTLIRTRNDTQQSYISPLEAYCFVSDKELCIRTLNPIISSTFKFISNPNQIFTLSLQTAAKDLQHIISSIRSYSAFSNCSTSLRDALNQIRDPLATMRINPFVESLSSEQRGDMMNRIMAVEEDVMSCVDDLAYFEAAAAAGEVQRKLIGVKVYLNGAEDFLIGYDEVLQMYEADNAFDRRMISENLFGICLCGSQLLFVFCLFCSLFRTR